MKYKHVLLIVVGLGLAVAGMAAERDTVRLGKREAMANTVLARFKTDLTPAARLNALSDDRARVARSYSLVPDLVLLELDPLPNLNQTTAAPPQTPQEAGRELLKRIHAMQATGRYEYVEPNYIVHASATPTDAAFGNGTLWGLKNGTLAGADIAAEAAWDITTGSPSVIVAIIDTGIRPTHQDLAGQLWTNPGEIPGNGVDDDNDGYIDNVYGLNAITDFGNPIDDNDHGTHVAGTIGARANGGGPHVGVAWNVKLMACKFLDANGSGTSDNAIQCVEFAVANGAKILNNSWGGGGPSTAMLNAIEAARNAGVLFVAAAGNESSNNDSYSTYPASYHVDNILSVAAVDRQDKLAAFSNYGATTVHLGAPGVDIYSTVRSSDTAYASFSGTSMATPHVSGVAALLWSQFPSASLAEIRQRLLVGAVPIASLSGKTITGGRLNALNSLTATSDGTLEVAISSDAGFQVFAGHELKLFVRVTDFFDVNNATVSGAVSVGNWIQILTFQNDGTGPDATANDAVYSASITVPQTGSFSLNVDVTAPGKTAAAGSALFTVLSAPGNDQFANAENLISLPALVTGSTELATGEPGEPSHAGWGGDRSVWYQWTATDSSVIRATTAGSVFDTVLAVYTGNSVGALTEVVSNDQAGDLNTSEVLFQASPGTTYRFAVDGFFSDGGDYQLNVTSQPPIPNDDFADRTVITNIDVTVSGFNFGATAEAQELPHNGYFPFRSVWWEWDNRLYGEPVVVSTVGSSYNTQMAIYVGDGYGSLVGVGGNVDAINGEYVHSEIHFNAVPGQKYKIVVDGQDNEIGTIQLSIAKQPLNDTFYLARELAGTIDEDTGLNLAASGETGEPGYDFFTGNRKSIWWKWTAPSDGVVTVSTAGSTFDTTVEVYTGQLINELEFITWNDDESYLVLTSEVTFQAEAGTTYYFQVDGYFDSGIDFSTFQEWYYVQSGRVQISLNMDGASKLEPPVRRSDESVAIAMTGEAGRPYVLDGSVDLSTWTSISTNTPVSQKYIFTHPKINPNHHRFYRVRPAPLIR